MKYPYGWRARIGLLVLMDDWVTEPNMIDILGRVDGVAVYVSRMRWPVDKETHRVPCNPENYGRQYDDVEKCVEELEMVKPNVICFCCTAGSVVIGDQKIISKIKAKAPDVAATTTITSVINGLKELGLKKIAMGTPYPDEINAIEKRVLESAGFTVVNVEGLQKRYSDEMMSLTPDTLYWLGRKVDRTEADGLFISCGGLNLLPVIEKLEMDTGKPVVGSNPAMAWEVLRKSNVREPISGCGELLKHL